MTADYQKKLDGLNTSFSLAKDEYFKAYPQAKLYPKVSNYQKPYERAKEIITSTNSDLFVLENEIRSNISKISKDMKSIDDKINEVKNSNEKLQIKSSSMEGSDKGAKVRFINSRQSSYTALYKSIFLTVIGFYTVSKLRKSTINN